MQQVQAIAQDLGLVRTAPGSLGLPFVLCLIAGCSIAAALGMWTPMQAGLTSRQMMSLLVWQPFIEELLFRGVLLGYLLTTPLCAYQWHRLSAANLLTSIAFGTAHLVTHSPLLALGTIIPGLLFGYFRERSGSLLPALLLHMAFNAAWFSSPIFLR